MTPPAQPLADSLQAAPVEQALAERLEGYGFDAGAVVIQIPQVPSAMLEPGIARNRGYFAYPPQSLFYLGAVFEALGVPTRLVDLNYETLAATAAGGDPDAAWQRAVDEAVGVFDRPFVCVSFMFDPTYPQLLAVVRHVKARWPGCCVAVGGVAATADPERVLKKAGADLVFSNEGERPLEAFYGFLRGTMVHGLHNIAFLDTAGRLVRTETTVGGEVDLDIRGQLSKLPLADYNRIGSLNNFSRMRGIEVPFATILSRRGCRAKCTFCAVRNFNGKSVRVREISGVVDEMAHLVETQGIRHFDWLDDDLLYDHDDAVKLFDAIADRLPGVTWAANNGLIAAAVTPALMEAMQRSGGIGFGVGLETGNKEMLRKVRKPATIEKFYAFAELSKAFPSMHYLVNFILGLPGETFAQMLDSFRVATTAALDWNNFFTFQPLKNTDAYLAYGGMDDGRSDEDVTTRGTTNNFNPVRGGNFRSLEQGSGLVTGYEVFEMDPALVPDPEQRKEVWFSFNAVANFLRMPALATDQEARLRNGVRWLEALCTAYAENPSIDCVLYYLQWRLGALDATALDAIRCRAHDKFQRLPYWAARDRQFGFSAFLDRALPAVDPRALRVFGRAA